MKKLILVMVFVLTTGTMMNANAPKEKAIFESCLLSSYNAVNAAEANSPGGAYSWSFEKWSVLFQLTFDDCNSQEQ